MLKPPWPGCRLSTMWRTMATCGDACERRRAQETSCVTGLGSRGVAPHQPWVCFYPGPFATFLSQVFVFPDQGGMRWVVLVAPLVARQGARLQHKFKKTNDDLWAAGHPPLAHWQRGGRPPLRLANAHLVLTCSCLMLCAMARVYSSECAHTQYCYMLRAWCCVIRAR